LQKVIISILLGNFIIYGNSLIFSNLETKQLSFVSSIFTFVGNFFIEKKLAKPVPNKVTN